MKHCILMLAILGFALSSPAAAQTYHFSAYLFDGKEIFKPAAEGDGDPDVCELLFDASYESGRSSSIPKNATVYGVIAVTDGKTSKIIPLFTWSDDKGFSILNATHLELRIGVGGSVRWIS